MNTEEFRKFAKTAVDYIADYLENISDRQVLPSIEPGYLQHLLPREAPSTGESWQSIFRDLDRIIMPGLTHWHSPNFHAYYPTANSYPGVVGELLLSGLGVVSTDELSSPAIVELELKMMDWLGKIIHLPEEFLNSSEGPGGGIIQNAASESTLLALLVGKKKTIGERLVAYTSEQSNSSVEKAGLLASVPVKLLPTDEEGCLRGDTLLQAILRDKEEGITPCCVVATLGTTGTCAFDKLEEIGPICQKFNIWLHVDAAYAGSAFACPEYHHLMKGVEFADSFNINPHKWMLVNSDCSAMWFKNTKFVEDIFNHTSTADIPEIQYWQIPNSRRFRALKLWFVLRIYGVEGIQKHIRRQIFLAKEFKRLVEEDSRFKISTSCMGLVCFRMQEDQQTRELLNRITTRKNIFIMPYYYQKKFVIRFVICSRFTEEKDIVYAWNEIKTQADIICNNDKIQFINSITRDNHISIS